MIAPGSDCEIGHNQKTQDQKSDGAHGPGKANSWNQSLNHDWKDDPSNRCTRRDDSERCRAAFSKPRADGTCTRVEDGAHTDGAANRLCEEELVVFRAERGHHKAKDVHQGAREKDVARAKGVEEMAKHNAAEEHQRQLCGRDPGDGGWRIVGQRLLLVVGLEDANAGAPPKASEEGAPRAKDDEPGLKTAIRRGGFRGRSRREGARRATGVIIGGSNVPCA